ncbi:MAG: hypothetical protein J7497_13660, partial [Chitinophagaceae bacterium]|nr:hypothetical protein [Chitinophagaceae bacterium]
MVYIVMDPQELQQIINNYINGNASSEEKRFLEAYYNYTGQRADALQGLDINKLLTDQQLTLTTIHEKIDQEAGAGTININPQRNPARTIAIRIVQAAAILIMIGIGTYLWNNNKSKTEVPSAKTSSVPQPILPGGQRATLTLSDGTTIILDSAANGQLATQGNSSIIKKDGIITYSEGQPIPSRGGVVSPDGETGVG